MSGILNKLVLAVPVRSANKLMKVFIAIMLFIPLAFCALVHPVAYAAGTSVSCLPSSGISGSEVLIIGKGFSGELAAIHWGDRILAENVPISDEGSFIYTVEIPSDFRGEHEIFIDDDSNWSGSTGSVFFTIMPSLSIFPLTGEAYTPVSIKGEGFGYREDNIKIILNGVTLSRAAITANNDGTWSSTVTIPSSGNGRQTFSASGSITTTSEIGEVEFIVTPWSEIEPQSGPAGTNITINAWGFVTSEIGVTVTWDGEVIKRGLVAHSDGTIEYILKAPESARGVHSVGIYGRVFSRKGSFPDYDFEILPSLTIEPSSGNKGTAVSMSGTGFKDNDKITVYYDEEKTDISATTDMNGSFSAVFIVPQASKKTHIIKVADTQGNSQQASFTVENLPPSEPYLLAPPSGERIAIFDSTGDMLFRGYRYLFDKTYGVDVLNFSWSQPAENGSLSYVLQVASDENFSTLSLNKEVDYTTIYTSTGNDPFSRGHYWWRVKSVDSYGNESAWSDTAELEIIVAPVRVIAISSVIIFLFICAVVAGVMVSRALTIR
jgi:hypothetical protein